MSKKRKGLAKRRVIAKAKITAIVASHIVDGSEPHPALLKYIEHQNSLTDKNTVKKRKKQFNFYKSGEWLKLRYETLHAYPVAAHKS